MKQKGIVALLISACLCLSACAATPMPTGERVEHGAPNVDRKEIVDAVSPLPDHWETASSDTIDAFIAQYNEKQTDESLRVPVDYGIFYDTEKDAYYIADPSSDPTYLVMKTNKEGEVVSAGAAGNDANKQIGTALAVMDVMKMRDPVPPEVRAAMNELLARMQQTKGIIASRLAAFEKKVKELDLSLPEYQLPKVSAPEIPDVLEESISESEKTGD